MKKLLIAIDNLGGGGAEKVLINLLKNLDKNKYSVTLLLLFNEGVYLKEVPPHVKINYLFNPKSTLLRKIIYKLFKYLPAEKIYKKYVKETFDIEIAFLEGCTTKLISGSANPASKKIAWVHTDFSNHHWTVHYYKSDEEEKQQYQKFNDIVFVSNDSRKGFETTLQLHGNHHVIYNPIDAEDIIDKAKEERIVNKKVTICSVGRLIKAKGFDRLINVHARLIKEGIDHDLVLIGEGEEKESLHEQCRQLDVSNSVHFLGFQSNPYKFVAGADLYVSSSRAEGLPLVVAEALILGTPVLSTRCSGPVELLDNGRYGMIVENSEEGLYEGVKQFLLDSDERKRYGELALSRRGFFNIKRILEQIEELIDA
ncbi:glycosyltransferase [Neobacillus niacini]|uniref:glycosyltransferase n=1 Tax=Neobacillus niacini TaxID=86668 RepID=UPI0039833FBB